MSKRPLGAQISHMLKARGVDVIFGIPGVHNVEMYRGIEEAGITHVLARHEQGAGFMADGYARASGKPGVAYVITGPGLCNAMTPMGQAYSDSVPVLVISSCLDETASYKGQLHQMKDQAGAAATVCDWSHEAYTPEAAYQLIERAFAEFKTSRPRTKHIQVPIALAGADALPAPAPQSLSATQALDLAKVAEVAQRLSAAKRPLFVFGGGAKHASAEARAILAKTKAASFSTYAGRGVVSPEDPLSYGATLARPASADVIATADLVIAVGTELSEVDLWRRDLGHRADLIRVDIDPMVLADQHRNDVQILSDAQAFLAALDAETGAQTSDWKAADVAKSRDIWRTETDAERPGIVAICDALRAALPSDAMYFSDMTQFAYVGKEVWDMDRPGHWHHPSGFGTLGYALPAAIGGAMARRGQPTVCIAGDYGFQYTVQELGAAVEMGLGFPILLWDNAKLKEIEDSMVRSQIAPNAVTALNPDFLALGRAYGCHAVEPTSFAELTAETLKAFDADRPTVIRMTPALTA
ncbi:5-guanidino-2-oxopentanoate decarboxylase [Cognatishimia sp.]|uniref:5-guanidino-2-oxopentanoate decarboxylase n=1 Tax=Cognatishimia sp. TaxID=2211648 RepID=UPI003517F0B4